jgi:hypothetical protein
MDDTTARDKKLQPSPKKGGLAKPHASPMAPKGKKERWQNLQSHLDQALNQWNEISKQMENELSPDEKRLKEVKTLLNQLKIKLNEF